MARYTRDIKIDAKGRDAGKTYRITEMSAQAGEEWALRAINGVARAGVTLPDDFQGIGMAGVAMLGAKAFAGMAWIDMKPLLDEMFACIQIVMPAGVRSLVEDDIEEPMTRLHLRKEVFDLHTGFFSHAAPLTSNSSATAEAQGGAASPMSPTSPA